VRLLYAQALVRKKEYDEAIVILGPVANNPHGGGAASAAQDMLRRIKANR
jgi:hypothetical protein